MTSKLIQKSRRTVLAALAAVLMSATQPALAHGDKFTLGLAVANLQADFFNFIKESVEEEAARLGYEVITVDANGDSARQVSQIQDLITRRVDALIYIPAGATAASVPVRDAKKAGIPVVSVDRNPPDAPGDSFIATDSEEAARVLGEFVAGKTGGQGVVGVVQGQLGTTPEIARDTGFEKALANYPGLKTVEKQASEGWHMDEGFAIAQDLLQRNPNINVIFGRADALAMGAAQAVKVANLGHDVLVVGFDGDREGLVAVKEGRLAATMTQQTRLMGRLAVRFAVDLVENRYVPPEMLLGATLTTKENVDQFIQVHP